MEENKEINIENKVVDISNLSMNELKEKYKETKEKIEVTDKKIKELEEKNKEENKGKINLSELVYETIRFLRQDITQEEFAEFGKKLTIRPYLPMDEKTRLIALICFNINNNVGMNELKITAMYKDLFFEALLGGYALIDVTDVNAKTYKNMDILYPIFSTFILQYCRDDYNILVNMVKDCLNFYNIEEISKVLGSIDYEKINKETEANRELIKKIEENKDLVKDLKDLMIGTNPVAEQMNKALSFDAINEANEKVKNKNKEIKLNSDLNSEEKSTDKKRRGRPVKKKE